MKSRAKDDLSSGYEPTDMSDERELESADEIREGEAKESPRRRSFRPRKLDERSWEATRQWRCRWLKTLIGWIAVEYARGLAWTQAILPHALACSCILGYGGSEATRL